MSFNGGIFTGRISQAVIIALLIGAALSVASLTVTSGQLHYNGHTAQLPNNTGTFCFTNSTCGGSGLTKIQGINLTSTGQHIFKNNGNVSSLNFKSIFCSGLTCSENATSVRINETLTQGLTKIQGGNLSSSGYAIFKNNANSSKLNFKTITCSGLTCSQNSTNVRINSTANGVTITKQLVLLDKQFDNSQFSSILLTVPHYNVTLPNRAGGVAHINFALDFTQGGTTPTALFRIIDGNTKNPTITDEQITSRTNFINIPYVTTLSGQVVLLQIGGNTNTISALTGNGTQSYITSIEISTP